MMEFIHLSDLKLLAQGEMGISGCDLGCKDSFIIDVLLDVLIWQVCYDTKFAAAYSELRMWIKG